VDPLRQVFGILIIGVCKRLVEKSLLLIFGLLAGGQGWHSTGSLFSCEEVPNVARQAVAPATCPWQPHPMR
jgi:hypothetical protein